MQSMREVLRGSLGRSLKALSHDDRLRAAWPIACGSAMAAHGELLGVNEQGVLQVRVESAAWLKQFVSVRTALSHDLSRIADVPLKAIDFQQHRTQKERAGV